MMSPTTLQLFRAIHIVFGAVWLGAVLFLVLFLMPTLKTLGPATGPAMAYLTNVRKLPIFMMVVPILAILSGLALYGTDSAGFSSAWMRSGPGRMFGLGGGLAILAAIGGMAVNAPAGKRLGAIGAQIKAQGGPPTPEQQSEMQRLQQRMTMTLRGVAVLLILATLAMAVARYMPT